MIVYETDLTMGDWEALILEVSQDIARWFPSLSVTAIGQELRVQSEFCRGAISLRLQRKFKYMVPRADLNLAPTLHGELVDLEAPLQDVQVVFQALRRVLSYVRPCKIWFDNHCPCGCLVSRGKRDPNCEHCHGTGIRKDSSSLTSTRSEENK